MAYILINSPPASMLDTLKKFLKTPGLNWSILDHKQEMSHLFYIIMIAVILHLIDRQVEYILSLNIQWNEQLESDRVESQTVGQVNRILLENILPPHVLKRYLYNTTVSYDQLYHESHPSCAVMFASIPNYESFYTENNLNEQGLKCLQLLNEIICDFDQLLSHPAFRSVEKIKTIGSTYMAACFDVSRKSSDTGLGDLPETQVNSASSASRTSTTSTSTGTTGDSSTIDNSQTNSNSRRTSDSSTTTTTNNNNNNNSNNNNNKNENNNINVKQRANWYSNPLMFGNVDQEDDVDRISNSNLNQTLRRNIYSRSNSGQAKATYSASASGSASPSASSCSFDETRLNSNASQQYNSNQSRSQSVHYQRQASNATTTHNHHEHHDSRSSSCDHQEELEDVDINNVVTMVCFATALMENLARINRDAFQEFRLRIGIAIGPVIAGVVGATKPTYDIWGDTVNVASRLESSGILGRIQVSEQAARILISRDQFQVECRGPIEVKGKGQLTTYLVVTPYDSLPNSSGCSRSPSCSAEDLVSCNQSQEQLNQLNQLDEGANQHQHQHHHHHYHSHSHSHSHHHRHHHQLIGQVPTALECQASELGQHKVEQLGGRELSTQSGAVEIQSSISNQRNSLNDIIEDPSAN